MTMATSCSLHYYVKGAQGGKKAIQKFLNIPKQNQIQEEIILEAQPNTNFIT